VSKTQVKEADGTFSFLQLWSLRKISRIRSVQMHIYRNLITTTTTKP